MRDNQEPLIIFKLIAIQIMSDSDESELKIRLLGQQQKEGRQNPQTAEELKLPFLEESRSKTVLRQGGLTPHTLGDKEESKFEMQDLTVRNMSPTTVFKRSSTLRPQTVGTGSSGNTNSDPEHLRGVTLNSKNTLVGSNKQPHSRNSGINNNMMSRVGVGPGGLATLGGMTLAPKERAHSIGNHSEGGKSNDSAYIRKQKRKQQCKIVAYNLLESILLTLLMLNAVVYPNIATALYFFVVLVLTAFCLAKNEKKIKLKQFLAIAVIFISFAVLVVKIIFLVDLHKSEDFSLSEEEVQLYRTYGIFIRTGETKLKAFNLFMSLFFDVMELLLCILITVLYGSHRKDVRQGVRQDGSGQYLLNASFERHQEILCVIGLVFITIDAVFIQTVCQLFVIILLLMMMTIWAVDKYERNTIRHFIVCISQIVLLVQLVLTFVLQLGIVYYEVTSSKLNLACDMFGLILQNVQLYIVIIHIVALVISLQIIQLYRVVRASSFRNLPQGLMPADDQPLHTLQERDSDNQGVMMRTLQHQKKKPLAFDRGRTIGGGLGVKRDMKATTVDKFREKTMGMRQKLDESSIQILASQYYKDFSPQIWLWVCRFTAFIWCYAYHDFQSWLILLWIIHSTLFKSTRKFANITNRFYLPLFVLIFLFYYLINIPGVIEYEMMRDDIDQWRSYGFYEFSLPFLETGLMFTALLPFFFFMKSSQKYLSFNKDDQKKKLLQKLTDEKAPTIYYFLFQLLRSLDLIVFTAIFFSGVNKIDFYHIFLMFFFVAYVLKPNTFKRNYIVLLYYVDFFVFEKYLYSLIMYYIPKDGFYYDFAQVMGFSTEYEEEQKQKYFKYAPRFQQWILVVVVFIQYQVYRLFNDERSVKQYQQNSINNFKSRYPRIYHFWELMQHLKKEFLILICFVIFFMMIILSTKSIINWGFQIIICIFIITYVAVGNDAPANTGIKRLDRVWDIIIYYASIVLILQITYQFASLPIVSKGLDIDGLLNMLPYWIRKNLSIIGFQVYSTYIWQKFLIYLLYFSIGVYVRKQLNIWSQEMKESTHSNGVQDNENHSRNSDMVEDYDQEKANLDWEKEYLKIRFTTPYLVYKIRKVWVVLDKLSQILFVVISIMIMVLSNYWQISLSMAIHLSVFIGLCLVISSRLYQNRKREKVLYKGKGYLTVEEVGEHWTKYKRVVNEHQVKLRQRAWFFQFVVTLLCIALLYPTEFVYPIRKTFVELEEFDVVNILDYLIFYLFWGGIYHSPWEISDHGYFYNIYGYLIILVLLIFEKNAQQWALNRFGCSMDKVRWFSEIEENLHKPKERHLTIAEQAIQEEDEEEDAEDQSASNRLSRRKLSRLQEKDKQNQRARDSQGDFMEDKNEGSDVQSVQSRSIKSSRGSNSVGNGSLGNTETNAMTKEQLREGIRRWLRKRYKIKLLNGVKILLEDFIQLMLLISSVYKDSIIGLIILLGVFIYMTRRKIRTMVRIAWIVGFCMILQYGLALSNLTSFNNPMDFPYPFNPYPSEEDPEGRFFIPWYLKVPLLRDSLSWSLYLGMGISNTKLNGLWIDYAIMGFIQAHLFYFGCQLFSVDYKVIKGDLLNDMFDEYCKLTQNDYSPETIKKETRKLKHSIFLYNFYKGMQLSIFMHFHQITIVVTLLLAILARSLFSFGYIIVCMIMIYENHKFFRKEQKNFRLQNVLKYWLRPYVFIDITLQLIFQIPLAFIHDGQDIRWSWQNIIGFQEIWSEDGEANEAVARSIIFIILKTFTYFFVTLQIQIFSSTAYKKYVKKDLVKFLDMAGTKGLSIRMKFNNEKIEKIKQQQFEKKKMDDMLNKLKKLIKKWQQQFYDQEGDHHFTPGITPAEPKQPTPMANIRMLNNQHTISNHGPSSSNLNQKLMGEKRFEEDRNQQDDYSVNSVKSRQLTVARPARSNTNAYLDSNNFNDSKSSRMPQILEEEEFYGKDDYEILEKMKRKLGFFARGLIWLKKKHTEQIIFITSDSFLKRVYDDMACAKTNIYTKIERKILKDIKEIRLLNDKEGRETDASEIDVRALKRSAEYLNFRGLLKGYLALLMEVFTTYSDYVCYLLMIVSMMKNAGLISIVYPFIVFGYALMEEINPSKKFWYMIMVYSEFLILIKFLFQLQFWEAIFELDQIQSFQDMINGWHVGLQRQASGAFGDMLAYFLPEILILLAIMFHIQRQIISGQLYLREQELENIEEALLRALRYSQSQANKSQKSRSPQTNTLIASLGVYDKIHNLEEPHDLTIKEICELELRREAKRFYKEFPRSNSFYITDRALDQVLPPLDEEEIDFFPGIEQKEQPLALKRKNTRAASMVEMKDLKKIFNELQEQDRIKKQIKVGFVQKCLFNMQRLFYKNQFFARLFPSVKEQKPGKDLYAYLATFQFMICLFLIFFYTKMDADVTNISEVMTYNQFSGHMVIALFLQILVMIVDRYLYKSKTFIQVQEKELQKRQVKAEQNSSGNPIEPVDKNAQLDSATQADRGKSFDQFMKKESIVNNLISRAFMGKAARMRQQEAAITSDEEEEIRQLERQIVLEQTKITIAIVSKFYLQWVLLLFIHMFVFWYFPVMGNLKLQNHAYCDKKSIVNCNEFGGNWALVIFYLLYCGYFWVSGLQIRYGLPEIKKGNFMMNEYGYINTFAFKGFMAVPFLFELKTFADWTFTRTALDVFQWFILSSTHAELFIARCLQGRYQRKPLGKPIPFFLKFGVGIMGQFGIILLIAGPLLLFSTFNPISEKNPVVNAQIKLNILLKQDSSLAINTINLFTNNYVSELTDISKQQYSVMKFGSELKTKSYDMDLVQYVKMNNFSDTNWGVSLPNRQLLQQEFKEAAANIGNTTIQLQFYYQFDRSNQNAVTATRSENINLRLPQYYSIVKAFNKTFSLDCSANQSLTNTFIVPPFFSSVNLLSDAENSVAQMTANWNKGLRIFYSCKDYWIVDQYLNASSFEKDLFQANLTGVSFFTFSNRISPSYFKYSILTFYISIVLVIGKLIRNVLVIGGNRIFIYEIPNSEQLLMLCECIYIYRLRSQLEQEEELYFTFIDIMRSPEMIKAITGSSIKKKKQ